MPLATVNDPVDATTVPFWNRLMAPAPPLFHARGRGGVDRESNGTAACHSSSGPLGNRRSPPALLPVHTALLPLMPSHRHRFTRPGGGGEGGGAPGSGL